MKKYLLIAIITIPFFVANSQIIGELAPEKKLIVFPDNALGVDVIFSEGGFGLGGFYRRQLNQSFTFFTDFSISESKDDREMEYIDYWGQTFVPGKKNRIFILPLNLGLQYRLFKDAITDNLRPYINAGVGPSMVVTTPYEREFFSAFGKAHARYTVGGYIGFGANIGIDEKKLLGLNVRYYVIQFFDEGVEGLDNRFQKTLGGFFLTLNFGTMY
ncbi:MAG: hypothetical protein C0425_02865 [Chlorobiaceae bacterium]|nr:hypothetical protein [Chlorobiaceae bacterium]MBA4309262.1 hypothetical protein [Chlorobiaceae bacterium]